MKIRKLKYVFILSLGFLMSCKNYLDVNTDPNRSLIATPETLLPVAQMYIGNALGDRMAVQMNVWCQYWTTGPGTSLGIYDRNNMNTSDGNQLYSQFYQRSLSSLYTLTKSNEPIYQGIAKILMAYELQICVDLFGDVPYFEAFKADSPNGAITSPKFDDAKTIYVELIKLVNEGIDLINTTNPSAKHPGNDDVIYGGDLDLWLFFANSVKLKLYMRQINVDDVVLQNEIKTQVEALEADGNLILSNTEIAKLKYGSSAPYANPMWNDYKSSIGLTYAASKTSVDILNFDDFDLRIDALYDANNAGVHVGLLHGDVENASSSASFSTPNGAGLDDEEDAIIFDQDAPVLLITPWEIKLLLAEAAARGFNLTGGTDQEYYESAVRNNFEYFGFTETDDAGDYLLDGYYGAYNSTSFTTKMKSIAIQKWICFNGTQPVESWIEIRRLENVANPIFTSVGGVFRVPTTNDLGGSTFPSLLFYPTTEESYNTNFPGQNSLTDKVFWDN